MKTKKARYQCLKGDDTTYMVDYELEEFINTFNRVNHFSSLTWSKGL